MSAIRYSTFLIRRWHFSGQHERIEIQHIQSGATQQLDSLGAILDWMIAKGAQLAVPPEQQTPDGPALDSDHPTDG